MDPKNWKLPVGVEFSRKEVDYAQEQRGFSAEFKAQAVLEWISGKKSWMEASREHNFKDTVFSRRKQEFFGKASQVFEQLQAVQEK